MINDAAVKAGIARDFAVARKLRNEWNIVRMIPGGGAVQVSPSEEFYNLPLVLAYGVLGSALAQMAQEGMFPWPTNAQGDRISNPSIGHYIVASRRCGQPAWVDFSTVAVAGLDARNKVAHEGVLHAKALCVGYIDAVEAELRAWKLL